LSEVDTLIGVVGTLVGTLLGIVVTYVFEERKAKRELALRSLDNRTVALNEVFAVLTNCFFELRGAIHNMPKMSSDYNLRVVAPISNLERSVYERALYLSSVWPTVTAALRTFGGLALALQVRLADLPPQSLPPASEFPIDVKTFEEAYFKAGNAIGLTLGIPNLEEELRRNLGTPGVQSDTRKPRSS
jgi:hypothetical protein